MAGIEALGLRLSLGGFRAQEKSSLQKIASGDLVSRAANNAAALAVSEGLNSQVRSANQGVRNLSDGIGAVRVAESALSETSNLLGRLRELAVQGQNGTLNSRQRASVQREFDALASEVTRIAENTSFNGRKLLDGSTSGDQAITFEDGQSSDVPALSVEDQSSSSLGIDNVDVFAPTALDQIDAAIQSVSSARADLGVVENRLSSGIRTLQVQSENTLAAFSRIRDVDFAKETATVQRNILLAQTAIATQVHARLGPEALLKLI